jgi:hypothetical protein
VLACKAQAIRSARTVAATLGRCVLRLWLRRSRCCMVFHTSSTGHLARYTYSTSAVDQVPAARVVMSHNHPATARVGAVSVRPAFGALRRARRLARRVAVGSSLAATRRTG